MKTVKRPFLNLRKCISLVQALGCCALFLNTSSELAEAKLNSEEGLGYYAAMASEPLTGNASSNILNTQQGIEVGSSFAATPQATSAGGGTITSSTSAAGSVSYSTSPKGNSVQIVQPDGTIISSSNTNAFSLDTQVLSVGNSSAVSLSGSPLSQKGTTLNGPPGVQGNFKITGSGLADGFNGDGSFTFLSTRSNDRPRLAIPAPALPQASLNGFVNPDFASSAGVDSFVPSQGEMLSNNTVGSSAPVFNTTAFLPEEQVELTYKCRDGLTLTSYGLIHKEGICRDDALAISQQLARNNYNDYNFSFPAAASQAAGGGSSSVNPAAAPIAEIAEFDRLPGNGTRETRVGATKIPSLPGFRAGTVEQTQASGGDPSGGSATLCRTYLNSLLIKTISKTTVLEYLRKLQESECWKHLDSDKTFAFEGENLSWLEALNRKIGGLKLNIIASQTREECRGSFEEVASHKYDDIDGPASGFIGQWEEFYRENDFRSLSCPKNKMAELLNKTKMQLLVLRLKNNSAEGKANSNCLEGLEISTIFASVMSKYSYSEKEIDVACGSDLVDEGTSEVPTIGSDSGGAIDTNSGVIGGGSGADHYGNNF